MTAPPLPFEYFAAAFVYGAFCCMVISSAVDAFGDWRAKRGQRPELSGVGSRPRLIQERRRYRRMDMRYSDLADTPYRLPEPSADTEATVQKIRTKLADRDPELTEFLRSTAQRLAREKGAITSDDIWEVIEQNPRMKLKLAESPKVMATAWEPREMWCQTGRWPKSRRGKENHGRPVCEWQLREAVAA